MSHFTVVEPEEPDTTAPTVTLDVDNQPGVATVTVGSSEPGTIQYALDSGAWMAYTAPLRITGLGEHTVRAKATDEAGNTSSEESETFTVVGSGTGECPVPDTRATVIIDGDDTGVPNKATGNGCTINDLVAEHGDYADHAAFVRHVETVTAALVTGGTLTKRQQGTIVRAAARSDIGS
ncbi:OmpL47-type beta-barrel domain-containing protein [Actinoplanes sp. CA-131856]